jgi:DNA polymerase-3 subunit gamma/tau
VDCLATFLFRLSWLEKEPAEFDSRGRVNSAAMEFLICDCSSPIWSSGLLSLPYQVIARKWRPQTFDDVVGQDHVVRTLRNAISRNRIAHAYLFVGPRGTGKTSTARIFAKALNATGGPNADFDVNDPMAQSIADGSCLDVIEIDGASNNGIEQVRELRDTVRYAPAQGRFKVYIIDEVHMLSNQAFNALLKTLEEPPPHVKFIFATTDVQKVLPTIISRCQRFDLKPIPTELIVQRLKKIGAAEKINVSDAALGSIARMADGGMRDAQSIFDQMISFCGTEVTEADVLDVYGLVSGEQIGALAAALAAADHKKLIEIVDDCDANGRDLYRLLVDVQSHVRVALLDSIGKGGGSAALGTTMTTEQLTRLLDGLREGEGGVKHGLSEKINFEVALLKAVEASRARAIDSLIKELAGLADGLPEDNQKKKS